MSTAFEVLSTLFEFGYIWMLFCCSIGASMTGTTYVVRKTIESPSLCAGVAWRLQGDISSDSPYPNNLLMDLSRNGVPHR